MPKGPRGERRPADVVSAAVMVGKIATGEIKEKVKVAASEGHRKGGLKGGKARADSMTAERRAEIAKRGATARWKKKTAPAD